LSIEHREAQWAGPRRRRLDGSILIRADFEFQRVAQNRKQKKRKTRRTSLGARTDGQAGAERWSKDQLGACIATRGNAECRKTRNKKNPPILTGLDRRAV
jgi:hypothetical protein